MEDTKASEKYQKRVVINLNDYEHGEFTNSLRYENVGHPAKLLRFFIESYLAGDADTRKVVENYKHKNKIPGRAKKEYILKQEKLAKNTEILYNLADGDIEDIYDILDETLPD